MKTGIYLAALICASVLFSCSKDDNSPSTPAPPSQTRYQILTSHYWKMSNYSGIVATDTNFDSVMDTIYFNVAPDSCSTDDRYYLHTNGFFVTDPGAVFCSAVLDSSTWSLINGDTQILIDTTTYGIINISSAQIKVTSTVTFTLPLAVITDTTTFVYP